MFGIVRRFDAELFCRTTVTDSVSSSKFLSGLVAYLKSIHYDENGDTSLVKLSLQDSLFGAKLQLISPYFWQLEVELAKES